jgi:ribonuclease HII
MLLPLKHEQAAWDQGHLILAGLDEAGRGPLAGPVVAATVHIERSLLEAEAAGRFAALNDSKKLTPAKRASFFSLLRADSRIRIGVGRSSVEEIDRINILRATHLAMARALEDLRCRVDLVLVDGLPVPGLPFPSQAIVQGDAQSLLIAAASIIAKVTRDIEMEALDAACPGYGFAQHKGYGTAAHLAALRQRGPSPHHRRSFAPVAQAHLKFD